MSETRFRDVAIGQEFDFVGGEYPSFFRRCVKTSARTYQTTEDTPHLNAKGATIMKPMRCAVGSVNAHVYHVGERS